MLDNFERGCELREGSEQRGRTRELLHEFEKYATVLVVPTCEHSRLHSKWVDVVSEQEMKERLDSLPFTRQLEPS